MSKTKTSTKKEGAGKRDIVPRDTRFSLTQRIIKLEEEIEKLKTLTFKK